MPCGLPCCACLVMQVVFSDSVFSTCLLVFQVPCNCVCVVRCCTIARLLLHSDCLPVVAYLPLKCLIVHLCCVLGLPLRYPMFLRLEVHCNMEQQKMMVEMLQSKLSRKTSRRIIF